MSVFNAAGSQFAIASTYGSAVSVTAATNAASSVVTAAGHACVVGDYAEIVTGASWQRAERRVYRVSAVATNDITLEGFDTTNTTLYPAAGFVGGTVRRISAWTTMTQITKDIEINGGELRTADITGIADVIEKVLPTYRSPVNLGLPYFSDVSLSWLSTVKTADEAQEVRAIRMVMPSGQRIVFNGYVSHQAIQTLTDSVFRGKVDLLGLSVPTAYAT